MTTAQVSSRPFAFGRVVENTLHVLAKNPWVYLGLSAIFVGAPSLIGVVVRLRLEQAGIIPLAGLQAVMARLYVATAVGLFVYPMLAGSYVTALAQIENRRLGFGEAVTAGTRNWLSLFAVSVVTGLGTSLATLLFIVPGVILALMWLVAAPVKVIEQTTVSTAIDRSRKLTRGHRWSLLGLLLLLALAAVILGLLVGFFFGFAWGFIHAVAPAAGLPPYARVAPFVTVLIKTVVYPLHATCIACVYAELRGRAGAGAETVAATFA